MAVFITITVAGVYFYRSRQATVTRDAAPPAVPPTVQQRSQEFSFSQKIEDRTLFTVRASRATQFTEGNKSLLEDVWITIHGRTGRRFDNLHARECNYDPQAGRITCAGEVQIDLESAEQAKERPGERVIHLGTSNVAFERSSGIGSTDAPVEFRFPYGHGRAVGVTYRTMDATVHLHREVQLTLTSAAGGRSIDEPVELTGSAMEYHRDSRTLRLMPPVRVRQGQRELTSGQLTLEFDENLRAQRLLAAGTPRVRAVEPRGRLDFSAEEIVATFSAEGWVQQLTASRGVNGQWRSEGANDRLIAQQVVVQMEPSGNQPRTLEATGGVRVISQPPGAGNAQRTLETDGMRLVFTGAGRQRRIERAESLAAATVELVSTGETTRVQSQCLSATFDAQNRAREVRGAGGSEIERRIAGRPAQSLRSRDFTMALDARGQWTELAQSGAVRFREGERTAEAESARMVRATESVTLSGPATVADALTRTTADAMVIGLRSGEIRADGNVRTSYRAVERDGVANLAPQPAHISAAQLHASRDTGQATYTGRARLWQGDSSVEADRIELHRTGGRLEAEGKVAAAFPQARTGRGDGNEVWRVNCGRLSYRSQEGRVALAGDVLAESASGRIRAKEVDLFLASHNGSQQVTRAEATGGVTVWTGSGRTERRGTAERAEYVAAEGKFILSGGQPTLFDAVRGTTTGRQLTFFLADDRILVDSEGSRALTKNRVEK